MDIDDGQSGLRTTDSFVMAIKPVPHVLSFGVFGPFAFVPPVTSQGLVRLSSSASDSYPFHVLRHRWTSECPTLGGNGTFEGSFGLGPTWTAPPNFTGVDHACTLSVTVVDDVGLTATTSGTVVVRPAQSGVLITVGPGGTPNPVASGAQVSLSVQATSPQGSSPQYLWRSNCPFETGHGAFDSFTVQSPTWTAPLNRTGVQMPCTIGVNVTVGTASTDGTFTALVAPVEHTLTASPSSSQGPTSSKGVVGPTAGAVDSLGHALHYEWASACGGGLPGGTFSGGDTGSPLWTAPENLTGAAQTCTLEVTVDDGVHGLTQTASYTQTVRSAPHQLTIQSVVRTPNPVASLGTVTLAAVATDVFKHAIRHAWSATCAGNLGAGLFSDSSIAAPTWTAPLNASGATQNCTLTLTVDDGAFGLKTTSSYVQAVSTAAPGAQTDYRYYFAEGATVGGFFATRFALLNLDAGQAAHVTLEFQPKDTTTVLSHVFDLAPHTRATIDVGALAAANPQLLSLASAEFSTVVRADRPLVVDRTMTWDTTGYGSHAETAISAPASTWYLAEGATIGDFALYYLIQNPNASPLDFTVTYLLPPPSAPIVRAYTIGANTRTNIAVHAEPGLEDAEMSAIITSPRDQPIIVERAMYLTTGGLFYGAGHESAGIQAPRTQWFFAEGATGDFFDLFILVGNPNDQAASITASFLFDDGTTCATTATVDAKSRFNLWVDTLAIAGCPRSLADAAVSTTITSDRPVIAERSMWWPGPTSATWTEAHNAAGATSTGTLWAVADGEQGNARSTETYLLVANTSTFPGTARVTLYFEDGTATSKDIALGPESRTTVSIGAPVDVGGFGAAVADRRFGASIESLTAAGQSAPAQIVVERAMYANGPGAAVWAAGTDVLAARVR